MKGRCRRSVRDRELESKRSMFAHNAIASSSVSISHTDKFCLFQPAITREHGLRDMVLTVRCKSALQVTEVQTAEPSSRASMPKANKSPVMDVGVEGIHNGDRTENLFPFARAKNVDNLSTSPKTLLPMLNIHVITVPIAGNILEISPRCAIFIANIMMVESRRLITTRPPSYARSYYAPNLLRKFQQ